MDPSTSAPQIKKQDDDDKPPPKQDVKPVVKTLNRVPRACNACRKQKMRCEGADNPPCRRCRNTGLECLFEKPSREATLTGEAGLERIRSLEAHVAEIRVTQANIANTLTELVAHLRNGAYPARSPSTYPQQFHQHSPPNMNSPSMSTPTSSHQHITELHQSPGSANAYPNNHTPVMNPATTRQSRPPGPNPGYPPTQVPSQAPPSGDFPQPAYNQYPPPHATHGYNQNSQGPVLPPFSSIQAQTMGPPSAQQNVSSVRYQNDETGHPQRPVSRPQLTGTKRHAPHPSSAVPSADSSDVDDDDAGDLPASGLVAPWEVLRGLADVAIERESKENGDSSEPHSRTRTPSPDRQSRRIKRRKLGHKSQIPVYHDVVAKNIINEDQARELFKIFYNGCSTFLPVFDARTDTYESLRERSPFAVDCICMVAARVRDGGGKPSEMYLRCLDEVKQISSASLFLSVLRAESVQAMILVAGWSDNGWLSGGHAVRMAMELSMHKAWPRLLRRMNSGKTNPQEDRDLVVASRIWFCLYLFEHQLSYGTGRPAVMKDDESIRDCRLLLRHPLAIEDDMRLVSTVELMAIREHTHNALAPFEGPVKEEHFVELRRADSQFKAWYTNWDHAFSQKYENAAFYRQSLQIQHLHAELFHNATALRGINDPADVEKMPASQKELALRSIQIARQGIEITVNSTAYREGMKYAVHYTHATATFMASFLLRLARIFPETCDVAEIRGQIEKLANLMSEIPGKRYALTLQLMLKRSKKRKAGSTSRSPKAVGREQPRPMPMAVDHPGAPSNAPPGVPVAQYRGSEPFSPAYEAGASYANHQMHGVQIPPGVVVHPQHYQYVADVENIWRGFEQTSTEQLPVWISESLGGHPLSQHGMDAFLLPQDYVPPVPHANAW
ncbi:hypothetical protein BDN72DRAFT_35198 [Pluteus cervinus]|uniref:Uncharacterized protein n=1 Tax=Pluteus cervinus TaxID=181527 RepID=A0ACD3BGL6_9AGAR|nr:hypothetical protein BDN72DRAFT_35198 [Pluteus cervinus]